MGRFRLRRVVALAGLLSAPFCMGCVHGDAVIIRDVRGRVLDRASGTPLGGVHVTAVLRTSSHDCPVVQNHGETSPDGGFDIPVTVGSGSVTWILFVPVVQGDRAAPKVEGATIVVQSDGRSGEAEGMIESQGQSTTCARRTIELGDLEIDFAAPVDE